MIAYKSEQGLPICTLVSQEVTLGEIANCTSNEEGQENVAKPKPKQLRTAAPTWKLLQHVVSREYY